LLVSGISLVGYQLWNSLSEASFDLLLAHLYWN
jgi:hypothetical protein